MVDNASSLVVGSFRDAPHLLKSVERAQEAGVDVFDVYSPIGLEVLESIKTKKRSPVRFATFSGGLLGLAGGLALAIWSSLKWNLIVGGKPVTSLPPFLVVGFEFTILLGAIFTLLALLLTAGLPFRRFPPPGYKPEFSEGTFGLVLRSTADGVDKITELLRDAGASDIHVCSNVRSKRHE